MSKKPEAAERASITPLDITRLLWLCYSHGGEHPDLPSNALESLRKFPKFVEITEPDSDEMRLCYCARLTDAWREYCERVAGGAKALLCQELQGVLALDAFRDIGEKLEREGVDFDEVRCRIEIGRGLL